MNSVIRGQIRSASANIGVAVGGLGFNVAKQSLGELSRGLDAGRKCMVTGLGVVQDVNSFGLNLLRSGLTGTLNCISRRLARMSAALDELDKMMTTSRSSSASAMVPSPETESPASSVAEY